MNTCKFNYTLLPKEIINMIGGFLPPKMLMWLNKKFYIKFHKNVKSMIDPKLYDNYIRDVVRLDNSFVFYYITKENIQRWVLCNKNINYKNAYYPNFVSFIIDYCIQNNATKCRNIVNNFLNSSGLGKNQHKKIRYLNIRWRT